MKNFMDNLKRQATENPVAALAVGAIVITSIAKLMDANTQRSYAQTHAREVTRRTMKLN